MKHSIQNLTICWNNVLSTALLLLLASACYPQSKDRQLTQPDTTTKSPSERRIALVIGNSAYRNVARLDNPANDAGDMAALLRQLGFELIDGHAHTDQNVEEMKRLILKFGEQLKRGGGVGLFYYAGHGLQVGGRNYLIPIEAENLREQTIEFEAVDVGRVLAEMDAAGNGFNIIILDACRSNPFAKSWRSTEGGLAAINAPEGTLIAYATGPGKVASDGNERNGVYTGELLKQLSVPELNVEAMFKAVRARVRNQTKGQQIPWESSSLIGDFYFSHKDGNAGLSTGPTTPQPPANVLLKGVPFTITPESSAFAFKVQLAGEYLLFPSRIELMIDHATITNSSEKGGLDSITFGLATTSEGSDRWFIASRAKELSIGKTLARAEPLVLRNLYFSIPTQGSMNLFKSWLVIEMRSTYFDSGREKHGTQYAHTPSDIFRRAGIPAAESKGTEPETDPLKGTIWLWRDASIDTLPVFLEFLPDGNVRTSTPRNKNGYIASNTTWYRSEETLFVLYFNDADRKTLLTECKGQVTRGRIEGTTRDVKTGTIGSWVLTKVSN